MARVASAGNTARQWIDSASLDRLRLAADSSMFALGQELLVLLDGLRDRRNVLAHRWTGTTEPAISAIEFATLSGLLTTLEALVDDLDVVEDAKLPVLRDLLALVAHDRRATCVFVNVEATGRYLMSVLGDEHGFRALLTGDERLLGGELERVRSEAGILVIIGDAIRGYDLGHFNRAIHYDLPLSEQDWHLRMARLGRLATPDNVEAFVMLDADGQQASGQRGYVPPPS